MQLVKEMIRETKSKPVYELITTVKGVAGEN